VFKALVEDMRRAAGDKMKSLGILSVVAVLAAVALFFFTLAAFVWAGSEYGVVAASLGLGVLYLGLAITVYVVSITLSSRPLRPVQRPHLLQNEVPDRTLHQTAVEGVDPVAMAMGIEVLRLIGPKKALPAFALGALAVAALQTAARANNSKHHRERRDN